MHWREEALREVIDLGWEIGQVNDGVSGDDSEPRRSGVENARVPDDDDDLV